MLSQIKRLGTDTAIYGISTILGRFLSFLLVFFYTNVLFPREYGIVATVYAVIAFLNIIYAYGLESAYFKYSSTLELGTAKQNFSTPFMSLAATSLVFSGLILALAGPIGRGLAVPGAYPCVIPYSAGILFLDTLAIIPFASLRVEHRPGLFATLKFLTIGVNVACNLVFLLVFRAGIEGIFLSGLISSAFTVATLLPTIARHLTLDFSTPLYRALLAFGLPYVPAGLATMVIQVVDRPVMRMMTDAATVGVYQANYRLGIFMMLIVSMFDYAWRPFFLARAADPGAKQLFARVLTYFVAVTSFLFLCISFFIGDLVRIRLFGRFLIGPDYWGGLSIVPVILLAYMFLGVYNNLVAGIYIEKKTRRLPGITLAGALANIVANFALIPLMGMMGAAIATLIAYVVMALALYRDVRKFYPVEYEWGRILKIAAAAGAVFGLHLLLDAGSLCIPWNILLVALFCGLLFVFRFFNADEKRTLRGLFRRTPPG